MLKKPFIGMVMLSCAVVLSACADGDPSRAAGSSTEVNLVITDPTSPADEIEFLVDTVSYRIVCLDSDETPQIDSVDLAGNFEIVDGMVPPVWTLVADLPPSICTISLWVVDPDGEVVCTGTKTMPVVASGDPSTTNKFDIDLVCTLSANAPSGDIENNGTFQFVNGNYCPQLIWLGANPSVIEPGTPAVTTIQTYSFDPDETCGDNCDPQTCDWTANPPACTPGPDNGLSSTLFSKSGAGTFADPSAMETTYACDPLTPGPVEICVLVSDGDFDCDKIRCVTVECPDLCENVDCDDGNECTSDRCDPLTGLCNQTTAPDGLACDNCNSTCQAGTCDPSVPFVATVTGQFMSFQGQLQQLDTLLYNPYSGAVTAVFGQFIVNNQVYKGIGSSDILIGTGISDILLLQSPVGSQRLCGVETVLAFNGFDVLQLADEFIVLGDMVLEGGTANDLIWANAGDDTLRGNDGDDLLDGGPGNDLIEAGSGDDLITLWPGGAFDSVLGGSGIDTLDINAQQNQITITLAANPAYEYDILYLGLPMAEITEIETLVLNDVTIDLTACAGADCGLCGNGTLNGGEECDDGGNVDDDGCAANCTSEY